MRSKFPVLKEAWLLVNSRGTDLPDMSLQFVLSHLPESLEDLNLMLWNIYLQGYRLSDDENVPFGGKLRSISIINCNDLEHWFFEEMATMFEENGIGKVALDVEDCGHGDRELLDFTGYVEAGHICVTEGVY